LESDPIVKNYLSCQEVADYIGVHVNFIYAHREIPRICIGGKKLYRKSAIDEYLLSLEKSGGQKEKDAEDN